MGEGEILQEESMIQEVPEGYEPVASQVIVEGEAENSATMDFSQ
jgi:hypothetical protein